MTKLEAPVLISPRHRIRRGPLRRKFAPPVLAMSIFLISLLVPVYFFVGTLRLSPYLIVTLVLFVPCVISVLSGRVGRVTSSDILFTLFCLLATISILHARPVGSIVQNIGATILETLGPYLIARNYVRSIYGFNTCIKIILISILVLLPFAAYESLTGRDVILDFLGNLFFVIPQEPIDPRWGLHRAQVVFDHPILFGVYCASGFALTFYVLCKKSFIRSFSVVPSAFFSLSSAAVLMLWIQIFLISWEFITRGIKYRVAILIVLVSAFYFAIDILSHRTPFAVFGSYFTFSTESAYSRIMIWDYGLQSVFDNPLFGIGLNEWKRPYGMPPSVDNFWLLIAIRYGIPAALAFCMASLLSCYRLGRFKTNDAYLGDCRKGLLICLVSIMVAACTVHLWNAVYCFFMFLLGSGEWMEAWSRRSSPPARGENARAMSYVRSEQRRVDTGQFRPSSWPA